MLYGARSTMFTFLYLRVSLIICPAFFALQKWVTRMALVCVAFICGLQVAYAQPGQCLLGGCNTGVPWGATQTTATSTFVNSVPTTFGGEYNTYNITLGQQYEWSLCGADGAVNPTPDMVLTLADNTTNAIICFSDNVCGLQPKILWTATFTGVVRVYLHVVNCLTNSSAHTVRWRCVSCAATVAPANDLVCNATPIACGQVLQGTTVNATATGTGEGPTNNCGGNATTAGVWYTVAGNGQQITASLCATAWDSRMQVFSGTNCNTLLCVGGIDDNGPACNPSTSASSAWPSVVGQNYYILVSGFSTAAAFSLSITCGAAPPGPVVASDCANAVNICTNATFQIDPNGAGNVVEFGIGTISNPSVNPASTNAGCLLSGELNSTWMIVNVATNGTLEFSFGAPGGFGCLDWIMWAYNDPNTCTQILNNQLAPTRCNWNANCQNFSGMATPLPVGGLTGDFEAELNVTCGQRFLICLSNYSSQTTSLPLNFFGTATISCGTFTPITVNSPTICLGASAILIANGGNSYTWSPAAGLSATTGATVVATPTVTTTYTVNGTGTCGAGTATSIVTVNPIVAPQFNPIAPICSGSLLTLPTTSNNGISGTWSPAVNNSATTTYTFTPASGACATTTTLTVTVKPLPIALASAPIIPPCAGGSATLLAQAVVGATYSWTGPAGFISALQNPVINPVSLSNEGLYVLTVTLNGCSQSGNAFLNIVEPVPYLLEYENPYCSSDGEGTPQNAWSGDGTYSASPIGLSLDSETGVVNPSASNPGTYTVTYTPLGCGLPQQTTVVVLPGVMVDGIYHD